MAGDGRQALAALAERPFDAVLMDCHMPLMDGFQATAELRLREGAGRRTPVIAMTAKAQSQDRERCVAAGMDDFLVKPIDVAVLRLTLERWIGDGGLQQPQQLIPAQAVAPSGPSVITRSRLNLLRALGPSDGWGLLPSVLRAFLDAARPQLLELQAASEAGDHATVSDVAHRLRGAAANLGAEPLAAACAELEAASGSAAATQLLAYLKDELATACAELESVLAGQP
jgi:CheY-like chemotaxis protein